MTNPSPYSVGPAGYGSQPVYLVDQPSPDAVMGYHSSDGYGQSAHIVQEAGHGAVPVYLVNGPPPGSIQYAEQMTRQQHQAWAATGRSQGSVEFQPRIADQTDLLLQQF